MRRDSGHAIDCPLSRNSYCAVSALPGPGSYLPGNPVQSDIKFNVKASVLIEDEFQTWTATLKFNSRDVTTGVLPVEIHAASVHTGRGMKDNKLKSKDFFDVEQNPVISFKSTKVVQTSQTTFDVVGTFTIRGVSKPETLKLGGLQAIVAERHPLTRTDVADYFSPSGIMKLEAKKARLSPSRAFSS